MAKAKKCRMAKARKWIISSVIAIVVNVSIGMALTPVLADVGMGFFVPSLWVLLIAAIPLEILIAFGLINSLIK